MLAEALESWRDGRTKDSIVEFVRSVTTDGPTFVPPEERIAAFDNDGTLWCEKPMPIQLDFVLRRFATMVEDAPELRERQPWKATVERDHGWFEALVNAHYAGDDTDVKVLLAGLLAAYDGMSVEDFEASSDAFLRSTQHPTLGRGYLRCGYAPMIELLEYLSANGFTTYITSGGGRDFMRPVSQEMYGVPRERVIGSSAALAYTSGAGGGTITHTAQPEYIDDGPQKPIRIWSRTGRRPLFSAGNSNGDIPMLRFTQREDRPTLRLVVLHDDRDREFDYTTGAEQALEIAGTDGWTIASIKDDWTTVF
jgi:phosphoserine phosphatase